MIRFSGWLAATRRRRQRERLVPSSMVPEDPVETVANDALYRRTDRSAQRRPTGGATRGRATVTGSIGREAIEPSRAAGFDEVLKTAAYRGVR